jgi:hypothetical protein
LDVADGGGGVRKEDRGMTNRLRSFLLAAAASLGLGAFAPAHAVLAEPNPDPSQFVFIEGDGTYTIINNSTQAGTSGRLA